ncbi:hypothetical protein MAR_018334 [Mya arenaria]|uniref:Uncharacterized protein n=1 Tax=Mya arenaria TaxID=6604 RepID=A0ABY7EHV2_MYAAR|nr:hypothetical protein MAR_018334 [Mya arenaria]
MGERTSTMTNEQEDRDPLKNEMRFLHTGISINMQLRLRQAALARATGKAAYKKQQGSYFELEGNKEVTLNV